METELVMPNLNLAREITNNYFNNSKPYLYEDDFIDGLLKKWPYKENIKVKNYTRSNYET